MPGGAALLALTLVLLAHKIQGQVHGFQWTFGDNFVQQDFEECQAVPIVVESITNDTTALGVAPYYLIALEVSGVPTTSLVGTNPNNLTWHANHARGSTLMLTMIDSNGSTGGVAPNLYTMNAGSDTSCLPTNPATSSLASIQPNVTGTLTTCQQWGLTIEGGKKPYTVVLSALNSPVITNVTMGPDDDVFTFPDRADPNTSLMCSVVDATGQWGISSNTIHTAGSSDVSCVGLVSSSKTSAQIKQEAADRAHAEAEQEHRKRVKLVVGLVVGLGVPILVGLAAIAWLYSRRKSHIERGLWDNQDVTPRAWHPPDAEGDAVGMREVDAAGSAAVTPGLKTPGSANYSPSNTPLMEVTPIPPIYFDREIDQAHHVRGESNTTSSDASPSSTKPSPTSLTESSPARRRKMAEAQGHLYTSSGSSSAQGSVPSLIGAPRPLNSRRMNTLPPPLLGTALDPDVQPDIIIQHRDGGVNAGVVHELPPPYADRTAASSSPPSNSHETSSPSTS